MKIIGVDPGLSGAIAILEDKKVFSIIDMPVMAEGKKNKRQLNSAQLVNIIKENTNLVIEKFILYIVFKMEFSKKSYLFSFKC